jgi:hypothetical protein
MGSSKEELATTGPQMINESSRRSISSLSGLTQAELDFTGRTEALNCLQHELAQIVCRLNRSMQR